MSQFNLLRLASTYSAILLVVFVTDPAFSQQTRNLSHRSLPAGVDNLQNSQSQKALLEQLQRLAQSSGDQETGSEPQDAVDPRLQQAIMEVLRQFQMLPEMQEPNSKSPTGLPNEERRPQPGERTSNPPPRSSRNGNDNPQPGASSPSESKRGDIPQLTERDLETIRRMINEGQNGRAQQGQPNREGTGGEIPSDPFPERRSSSNQRNSTQPSNSGRSNNSSNGNSERSQSFFPQDGAPPVSLKEIEDFIEQGGLGSQRPSPGSRSGSESNNRRPTNNGLDPIESNQQTGARRPPMSQDELKQIAEQFSTRREVQQLLERLAKQHGLLNQPGQGQRNPRNFDPSELLTNPGNAINNALSNSLDRVEDIANPNLSENGQPVASNSQETTQNPESPDQSVSPTDRSASANGQAPTAKPDAMEELRKSGLSLREKLIKVSQAARKRSQTPVANGDGEATDRSPSDGWASAFEKLAQNALDGARDVEQAVTEPPPYNQQAPNEASASSWNPPPPEIDDGTSSPEPSAAESFTDSLFNPTEDNPVNDALNWSVPEASTPRSDRSWPVIPLLVIAAVLGSAYWFLRRYQSGEQILNLGRTSSIRTFELRTREDIIRAFHALADKSPSVTSQWWTHERAALAMVETEPKQADDVSRLAELYEQVRYSPDDENVGFKQVEDARQAYKRCGN